MNPVVYEEHMRPALVCISAVSCLHCWLGDGKHVQPVKNLCHLFPEELSENTWRTKTKVEPDNADLPGKQSLKWSREQCILTV